MILKLFQSVAAADLNEDWPVAAEVLGILRRMRQAECVLKGAEAVCSRWQREGGDKPRRVL